MRAEFQFECTLENGLHARPASLLADIARPFKSRTSIQSAKGTAVELLSVLSVIGLDVRRGDRCTILSEGEDAQAAINAVKRFIEEKLAAIEAASAASAPEAAATALAGAELPMALRDLGLSHATGLSVCGGIGVGSAVIVGGLSLAPRDRDAKPGSPESELQKVSSAVGWVRDELSRRATSSHGTEAELLRAHAAIASDPALTQDIERRVRARATAAQAVVAAAEEFAGRLRLSESAYVRDRVVDVLDVCGQVVNRITGTVPVIELVPESVVFAEALTAGQLLSMDRTKVRGLALGGVGATSHTVILARSFGIPTVIDLKNAAGIARLGQRAVLDAEAGIVVLDVTAPVEKFYQRESAAGKRSLERLAASVSGPVATLDGQRIEVGANASTPEETSIAVRFGADGVGLVRTELLFLDRTTAPSEAEQFDAYAGVVRAAAGRPVIIRTFDIGGDKPAPYLAIPREENPFLGVRGLRLYPSNPEVLRTQLRAILRASAIGPIKVMAPMVATAQEAAWFRARVREVQSELQSEGISYDEAMPVGVMLEIPAVALSMPELCAEADFFSIGSNDLCQYWMAVDRGNPGVAVLYNPLQPSFLRLLKLIVDGAKAGGRWIGMCGEMAGKVEHLPLLLGLGLNEISAAPGEMSKLKSAVQSASVGTCRALLDAALGCRTAAEVKAVLADQSWRTIKPVPVVARDIIHLSSDATTKAEAIKAGVDLLYGAGRADRPRAVEKAVWAREATYSTGLGFGFAVPHCKSDAVTSPSLAVVTLAQPVEWGSMDGQPVSVVMLLVVPASDASGAHMKVFAKLARKLMHEDFRDRVRAAGTAEEIETTLVEELGLA